MYNKDYDNQQRNSQYDNKVILAEIKPDYCEYTNKRDIPKFIIHHTKTEDQYELNYETENKKWEEVYDYLLNNDYHSLKTLIDCNEVFVKNVI